MNKGSSFAVLLIVLLLMVFFNFSSVSAAPRFLIIHVDAISSELFFEQMEAGGLPNLERVFSRGSMIRYGMTSFPGGTETTLTRLKDSLNTDEGNIVSYTMLDQGEGGRVEDNIQGLFNIMPDAGKDALMLWNILPNLQRRSLSHVIYGIPVFDILGGLALHNVPRLLEKYNIVEFYWFSSDGVGHIFGRDAQLKNLQRFDSYFGNMIDRLNCLENLNIIVYADHGMSYGDMVHVQTSQEAKDAAGDKLLYFSYPHVYLSDDADIEAIAKKIAWEKEFDYAFYRQAPDVVTGFHEEGSHLTFKGGEEGISYSFTGEDTLGYYNMGYEGEYLTGEEWLTITREMEYPAVPPAVYNLLMNPHSGHVVAVINPPRIPANLALQHGSHSGFSSTCLMVPILLKGPELEHLYQKEELWLYQTFPLIEGMDFNNFEPGREYHTVRIWSNRDGEIGGSLSFSPTYRWRLGLEYNDYYKAWGEYDFFSTFLTRLWLGAGLQYRDDQLSPLGGMKVEFTVGNLTLNYQGQTTGQGWDSSTYISYQILPRLSMETIFNGALGMQYEW